MDVCFVDFDDIPSQATNESLNRDTEEKIVEPTNVTVTRSENLIGSKRPSSVRISASKRTRQNGNDGTSNFGYDELHGYALI